MATLYARIPEELYDRINREAQSRGFTITACSIVLLEAALDACEQNRAAKAAIIERNDGGRYRDPAA